MNRRFVLVIFVMVASFTTITIAQGQEGFPTDNDVNDIAKKLYCPVCPNTPLDVCETKACQDWREQISVQLSDGWSEDQIIDYFVLQYGERVLAEPERGGFTSLLWLLPVIAVLVGLVVVWQALRSWRSARLIEMQPVPSQPEVSPETLAKIEKELRKLA
ncbi:MAG TPA: cytochrome c-type biogenesis protein [candidate division Zixibacteria bacterium]|nr:cytochrome c-type biogenesis protein [candidate division Zixibacteria bacterium]